MSGAGADPGLDRLHAAALDRAQRRPASRQLAAAVDADRPPLSLGDPAALAMSAPEPPRSIVTAGRSVYWATRAQLERRGVPMASASASALRVARGVALELAGFDRSEAACALGVSARQARRDRALVRGLSPAELADGELLPPVP